MTEAIFECVSTNREVSWLEQGIYVGQELVDDEEFALFVNVSL